MLGYTTITILTEQAAYSLDEEYYPLIRVFEAPYTVGDCPIDEVLVRGYTGNEWFCKDGTSIRASIDDTQVTIRCESENEYTVDKEYEVRIYRSNEPLIK